MLTLYRRHGASKDGKPCPNQSDRYWKRCTCPMWVEGTNPKGDYIRRSLKTRSWERAQQKIKDLEAGDSVKEVDALEEAFKSEEVAEER